MRTDTCTVTVTIHITSPSERQGDYQEQWVLPTWELPSEDSTPEEMEDFLIGYADFDEYPVWFEVTVDSVSGPQWDYLVGEWSRGAK